jgi:hypothetical protein
LVYSQADADVEEREEREGSLALMQKQQARYGSIDSDRPYSEED